MWAGTPSTSTPLTSNSDSSDTVFRLKPSSCTTAKVGNADSGNATAAMNVARRVAQEQEHHKHHQRRTFLQQQ